MYLLVLSSVELLTVSKVSLEFGSAEILIVTKVSLVFCESLHTKVAPESNTRHVQCTERS